MNYFQTWARHLHVEHSISSSDSEISLLRGQFHKKPRHTLKFNKLLLRHNIIRFPQRPSEHVVCVLSLLSLIRSSVVAVAAVDGQLGLGAAAVAAEGGDPLDHVLARLVGDTAEHHVLPVEPERVNTLENAYKIAICPWGNLLYKQIYFITNKKLL